MRDIPEEAFDKTMNANVKSNLWLVNAVVPGMVQREDGVILVIGSTGGLRGTAMLGVYGMSKAADMQLVRNITVEWRSEEHTSELQSLMRISYAVFCLQKKITHQKA